MRIVWLTAALLASAPHAAWADPEADALAVELQRSIDAGRELTRFRMPFANKYVIRRCEADAAPARERLAALGERIARLPAGPRGELEAAHELVRGCLECHHEATALCDRAQARLDAIRPR